MYRIGIEYLCRQEPRGGISTADAILQGWTVNKVIWYPAGSFTMMQIRLGSRISKSPWIVMLAGQIGTYIAKSLHLW